MRIPTSFWTSVQTTITAGLILLCSPGCKPAAKLAAPAKALAAALIPMASSTNTAFVAHISVFEQLMPPKGRDPFFPNSHRRDPEPTKDNSSEKPTPASDLVLKGIVGSTSHRLALVNDDILEVGEESSMRVAAGHVRVRCLEIGADYAVIKVAGEFQTKRLQLSKKGL